MIECASNRVRRYPQGENPLAASGDFGCGES